jgi:antirestriction protein ArdC
MRQACKPSARGPGALSDAPSRAADKPEPVQPNIYAEVTARIIGELEHGRFPWVQPWGRVGPGGPGLPHNAGTGARYSGINILILWGAGVSAGYSSLGWLTFRQALKLGGAVRKGERGTTVVYADRFTPKGEVERAAREGTEPGVVPFLKRFTVFNVAQ